MIKYVAALSAVAMLTACPGGRGAGMNTTVNTRETCDQIHHYINTGMLPSHEAETTIKLAAARQGVPEPIRSAIDAYYRGDHEGGRQAMLTSCANAGFPA